VDSDVELKYIIPGHAPYLTKADLTFLRDYYRSLWVGLNRARQEGLTLEQVKQRYSLATGFSDFPRLANPTDKMIQQHDKNLEAVWALLDRPTEAHHAE
jgi:hypothetical protein